MLLKSGSADGLGIGEGLENDRVKLTRGTTEKDECDTSRE